MGGASEVLRAAAGEMSDPSGVRQLVKKADEIRRGRLGTHSYVRLTGGVPVRVEGRWSTLCRGGRCNLFWAGRLVGERDVGPPVNP
jgi:hypothetical protein